MTEGSRRSLLGALALACLIGCGSGFPPAGARPAPGAYPGTLRDPSTLGRDFMWRQAVTASFVDAAGGHHSARFEAILQKRDGVLSVLGMTPFGSRAFLIEQRGVEVALTRFVDDPLPFPPRYILVDIHRTYFQLAGPAAPAEGVVETEVDGEMRRDRYAGGALVERSYRRLDGAPAGAIVIRYGAAAAGEPARSVTLDNGWFGYQLRIETLDRRWL